MSVAVETLSPLEAEKSARGGRHPHVQVRARKIDLRHPAARIEAPKSVVVTRKLHVIMRQTVIDVARCVDADALFREDDAVVLLVGSAQGVHDEVALLVLRDEFDLPRCEKLRDLFVKLSFM